MDAPSRSAAAEPVAHGAAPHPVRSDATGTKLTGAAISIAIAAVVGWWAYESMETWLASGLSPRAYEWTSGWPPLAVAGLVVALVAGVLQRSSVPALAGAVCTSALFASVAPQLPAFATNQTFGDGPSLMGIYVATAAALSLYVAAGPRAHGDHGRLAVALVFAATANTKLFERDGAATSAILLCLALLAVIATPVPSGVLSAVRANRANWWFVGAPVALVLWIGASVVAGDSLDVGIGSLQTVLLGAALCWVIAIGSDRAAVGRVFGALLAGCALCVLMAAVAAAEAATLEGWDRVLASRLRLFQSHSNIIAPYFGAMSVLCFALLGWRSADAARTTARRVGLLVLGGAALGCLWLTDSSASVLGCGAALAVAAYLFVGKVPSRPARWYGAAAGLAVLAAIAWWSPLADPVRAHCEVQTQVANSAVGQRYHYWRMSGEAILAAPILGVGPEQNYVHARYAKPSYFDSTRQTFHAHNLFLYVAEGSGIPALLLFLAGLLGVLEIHRRALLRLPPGQRALAIASVSAPVALLVSNMLDLGQVQPTYLPLYFWLHLGIGAALLRSCSAAPIAVGRPGALLVGGAFAATVALGAMPLVADVYIERGEVAIEIARLRDGEADATEMARIADGVRLARNIYSPHPRAGLQLPRLVKYLDLDEDEKNRAALAAYEWQCRSTPGKGAAWLDYAFQALASGEYDGVAEALAKAKSFDPRGPRVGEVEQGLMWLALIEGDEQRAMEHLLLALAHAGTDWYRLPHVDEELGNGKTGAITRRRFELVAQDGRTVQLVYDEALRLLGERMVELARTDAVAARRLLTGLRNGFWSQGRPEEALTWFERYRAIVPRPIAAVWLLEFEILRVSGRLEQAEALVASMHPDDRAEFAAILEASTADAELEKLDAAEARAKIELFYARSLYSDIYFAATSNTKRFHAAATMYARVGAWEDAIRAFARALREEPDVLERRKSTRRIVDQSFVQRNIPADALLDVLEFTVPAFDVDVRAGGVGGTMWVGNMAKRLVDTWPSSGGSVTEAVRARFEGLGAAGHALIERVALESSKPAETPETRPRQPGRKN